MIITPIQDNIIIKLPKCEKEKKTSSGIIISTAASQQELPERGIVIAIGEGRTLNDGTKIKSEINIDDEVIFNKFAGTKIQSEDEEYLIVKENDILAIIK